jgi:hypothetical protein
MPKQLDLSGTRFGRLLVSPEVESIDGRKAYWCVCDCGAKKLIRSAYLQSGKVQSCGCLRSETSAATAKARQQPNAKRNQAIYHRWASMKQRCENPVNPFFKNYGGRGIVVCAAWSASFDAFIADMGQPPTAAHTLDRIDNNGPYSPDNCRWALPSEQLRNQRRTILITIGSETLAAKDWAVRTGISYQSITKEFRVGGVDAATALVRSALYAIARPGIAAVVPIATRNHTEHVKPPPHSGA